MNYEVRIVRAGRGGWVYYDEDKATLSFEWDTTSDGFEVYLPPSNEWDDSVSRTTRRIAKVAVSR
jgi:hypothetical protein